MRVKQLAGGSISVIMGAMLILTGCGKSEPAPAANPTPESSASVQPSEAPKPDDMGKKYDIEFFVPTGSGGSIPSPDKDFVKKAIDEKFNVNLKVTHMAAGPDSTNKVNVRFASNTPPDLAVVTGRDSQTYAKDGLVADLRPFMTKEAMPNYYKWISDSEFTGYYTIEGVDDGLRAPVPFDLQPYSSWYIRKDWLDKLGLAVPTNYEETLEVMRQFTFNDPDGNGKDDTYGFSTSGNGANVGFDWPQWVKNGFYSSMYIDEGKLIDAGSNPDTVKVLLEIKDMIEEGIVDPNWFLNKGTEHFNKIIEGKAGIVKAGGRDFALEGVETSAVNRARQINPEADIVPFNPFPDAKGITSAPQGSNGFVVPKTLAEQDPDKVHRMMAILDFLASPEGFLLTHYGLENESYTIEGNKVTLKPDVIQKINTENGKFLQIYDFFTRVSNPAPIGLEIINPNETDRDRAIVEQLLSYKYVPYTGGPYVTPPAGINIADYRKEMNSTHAKIVFGDLPADKWPDYLEELMTKHKGREIFDNYTRQIREGGGFDAK
ncbi:extracellular solute-binding protein [Paenibacillus sp. J2TS4]|uniref:extracellular solute-binding protein n=1 Tax=Paenibacillus sp. J2TS4 TaxID=2807194 RepID=UPI001B2799BD|nr:extracellular solute-binding protein [Paenibacillus sp. J2TS4]GIP34145.1 lipoprotein LipO [Paenibacillus sp. J2TS4]